MNRDTELRWVHERSALVQLMLQEGFKDILCEGSYEDRDFDKFEGNVITITKLTDGGFIDTEGNVWEAVQPLLPNGDVMGYDDYLELKEDINKDGHHEQR